MLCSARCLFITAAVIGAMLVLYTTLFPVAEDIPSSDREGYRVLIAVSTIFLRLAYIGECTGLTPTVIKIINKFGSMDTSTIESKTTWVNRMAFGGVKVIVFQPKVVKRALRQGVLYFHGGGWTSGFIDQKMMLKLSEDLDAVIAAVDYRLSPTHTYPLPLMDCEVATLHFFNNAASYGVDSKRIAIGGDSAGGNLAAAVSLKLKGNLDIPPLKVQFLIYPALQAFDLNTPSYNLKNTGVLTKDLMVRFWLSYARGHTKDFTSFFTNNHTSPEAKTSKYAEYIDYKYLPREYVDEAMVSRSMNNGCEDVWKEYAGTITSSHFAPIMADEEELSGLSNTYIITSGHDVLRDDGYFYTRRLKEAGVNVTHTHYQNTYHGFFSLAENSMVTQQAFSNLVNYLRYNV